MEGLCQLKKSTSSGTRTGEFPAGSIVTQQTKLRRASIIIIIIIIISSSSSSIVVVVVVVVVVVILLVLLYHPHYHHLFSYLFVMSLLCVFIFYCIADSIIGPWLLSWACRDIKNYILQHEFSITQSRTFYARQLSKNVKIKIYKYNFVCGSVRVWNIRGET
jgi:hypothetical protein